VTALIDAGANVNAKYDDGSTALIYAAQHGYARCVQVLAAHGANVNAKDNDGETALRLAFGNPKVVAILKAAGAKE
jgi:ankyrin repeat protein